MNLKPSKTGLGGFDMGSEIERLDERLRMDVGLDEATLALSAVDRQPRRNFLGRFFAMLTPAPAMLVFFRA